MNRLGLSQPTVKTFLDDTVETPEKIEAQIVDSQKQLEKAKAEVERLAKLKEQFGEKKDAETS